MMEKLLELQRDDGMWGQLIDDPGSWGETSGTAMFAFAFIKGVKNGWLDAAKYAPAARKAYLAVCATMDELGNVAGVCIGTGAKNDRQYYYDRRKINGDPHGQAPLLWCVNELISFPAKRAD
jgi:rhamnogalacturonyl hydrolase YesR